MTCCPNHSDGRANQVSRRELLLACTSAAAIIVASPFAFSDAAPSSAPGVDAGAEMFRSANLFFASAADEVTAFIQKTFFLPGDGLYAHSQNQRHPDFMWGNGVTFSALLGGARERPRAYLPLVAQFFKSMDRYWDARVPIPGYEPAPTGGGGNDKYYDDNAWMVINFVEAFELTKDRRYLERARQTLDFVLSGWDDSAGGGIWWHEQHKDDAKNTCVNAPAAVGCLLIAKHLPPASGKHYTAAAERIIEWTRKTLENDNGLYGDRINVDSGRIVRDQLTYNTALMIRAFLGWYLQSNDEAYLRRAARAASAADWFLDDRTHAYRDPPKWSHLLVEADLQMYRQTREPRLLRRAIDNGTYHYSQWKRQPPQQTIENAAIARMLWLLAHMQQQLSSNVRY